MSRKLAKTVAVQILTAVLVGILLAVLLGGALDLATR